MLPLTKVNRALGSLHDAILTQEVPPGLNDDGAAQQAIGHLSEYIRLTALIDNIDMAPEQSGTFARLYYGMWVRAQKRCAEQHNLTQVVRLREITNEEELARIVPQP